MKFFLTIKQHLQEVYMSIPDSLFEIDGNRHTLDMLVRKLKTKEMLGFIGAGASAPLYPTWNQLIKKLAEEAHLTQRDINFWENDKNYLVSIQKVDLGA